MYKWGNYMAPGRRHVVRLASAAVLAMGVALPAWAAAPPGYQEATIGSLDVPGTTTVDNATGKWTVEGAAGSIDLAGAEDNVYFVYKTLTGDGSVVARQLSKYDVTGGGQPNSGVMIRESLAIGAPWSGLLFTTSTLASKHRPEADADIIRVNHPEEYSWPKFLRMQRTGNDVTGFASTDGKLWNQVTPAIPLPLGATAEFGIAMASRNGEPSKIEFDNVNVLEGFVSITGVQSAATNNMALITWLPISKAVGYNIYRGPKDATALDKMTLLNTSGPLTDPSYFDNSASDKPLRDLSFAVAPLYTGADGKPFEGPAVRAR